MVLKLYSNNVSAPVRAVLLTAAALGLELEEVFIDFAKHEYLDPKFIAINPQHTIPVLDDDGLIIWDSHAINVYLVTKYGKKDDLYPKDVYKRAVIDQRLHFDSGNVFSVLRVAARSMFLRGETTISPYLIDEMNQAYEILNEFLKNKKWAAGDFLSLADFSLISSVTSANHLIPIDFEKCKNIADWIKRAEDLPYYEINEKGLKVFQEFMDACKK